MKTSCGRSSVCFNVAWWLFKWMPGACIPFLSSFLLGTAPWFSSMDWAPRFSPTHLCLCAGARSKLFMIKHCSNRQVEIYWREGGWEEGVVGWSSVFISSCRWCYWCGTRVCRRRWIRLAAEWWHRTDTLGTAFCVGCIQSSSEAVRAAGGLFPLEPGALRSPCRFRNCELSLGGRGFLRSKALKHASGVMTHGSFKFKTYSGHLPF